MKPLLMTCLVGVVLNALPAEASCVRGEVGLAVNLPFVGVDVRASHRGPCPEVVLAEYPSPPPMVVAQPYVVVQPVPVRPQYVSVAPPPNVMARVTPPPVVVEGPSHLALKYLPGLSSSVVLNDVLAVGRPGFAHSLGLEFRFYHWFALRSDFEMRAASRSWDVVGAKFSLPIPVLSPYLSGSISASEGYNAPGRYQLGAVAAAGLDLKFGRHFFIEAEARYRVAPGACCREEPQVSALVGAGVAFF